MALLGTYIDAGAACLASGLTCFAHSLPSLPEHCNYQIRSFGSNAASIPVFLESYSAAAVVWRNGNGAGIGGEHLLMLAHSVIR